VDFNELVRVTGITVMGRASQYVKSFRIHYERDEKWRTFHPNRDFQTVIQQYSANVATRTFKYPVKADGLSITPVTWYGDLICMKIRLHGCAYVCQSQLFIASSERIKDKVITASSANYQTNGPKQTAIHGLAWCAEENNKNQWIQFNADNKSIFKGNNDPNGPMRHKLAYPIEASHIRIIPIAWNKNICMRISLLGCEADCGKGLLGTGKAANAQYLSSDAKSNPEYVLFNNGKAWCTGKSPLNQQYIE
ncbi:Hypothetical predicted protein, partial [Paramuricea clavata]